MKTDSFHGRYILVVYLLLLFLISACQTESSDFNKAREDNTIESYQVFLENHPDGEYTSQAKQHVRELEFNKIVSIGTIESYKVFLAKYPDGKLAQKVEFLLEDAFLNEANQANTTESYLHFLGLYPEGRYTSQVESKYVSIRIEDIYQKTSRDPVGDYIAGFNKSLESDNMIEELERVTNRNMAVMSAFNEYARESVKSDEYLSKYFNKLLLSFEGDEDLTIDKLNFWGVDVRSALEEDLDVDILGPPK